MELIINNSEKVSFFTALKVRKAYENTWTRWMKTWIVIAIIGSYFMFSNGIIQGLIYEGIILTSLIET